jgi:dihydroorotase
MNNRHFDFPAFGGNERMSIDQLFERSKSDSTVPSITIRRPDDWHVHLRDGEMLKAV